MRRPQNCLLLIGLLSNKAELPKEGILFCTQFPYLGIFNNKNVGFRKNQDHLVYNFKN